MASEITFREAIRQAIFDEMRLDSSIVLIGEDVGAAGGVFKVTDRVQETFGALRVRDAPIAETAIMGIAMGAAIGGLRPIVEIMFADFFAVCFDVLVNQMAKFTYLNSASQPMPVVVRAATGAGIRFGPHHSQNVEGWLLNIPGLKIVAPSNPHDAKGLLKSAIRDPNPVVFLEHKALYSVVGIVESGEPEPLGKAGIVLEGSNVTIVATMRMVSEALKAAKVLLDYGISAEVVDLRTVLPWDQDAVVDSVRKTHCIVTVEENPPTGGWGADVVAVVTAEAFDFLDTPPIRVTMPATPVPFSPPLEDAVIPHAGAIVAAVLRSRNIRQFPSVEAGQ